MMELIQKKKKKKKKNQTFYDTKWNLVKPSKEELNEY